ncbi:MAG: PAS domain S-box protein [Pseudomonadota bacterium]
MTSVLLILSLAAFTGLALLAHAQTARYGLVPVVLFIAALLSALNMVGDAPIIVEAFGGRVIVSAFVLLPVLIALPLVIYEVDGTVAARVAIVGTLAFSSMIFAADFVREVFAGLPGATTATGEEPRSSWRISAGSTAGLLMAYIGIAVVHQSIRNVWRGASTALIAGISLLAALWIDEFVFRFVAFGPERLLEDFVGTLPEKTTAALAMWPILGYYLLQVAPASEDYVARDNRGPLDVLLGNHSDAAAVLRFKERQRVEAESALAVSRMRFQHTFSEVRVGLIHADVEGCVQIANPYFQELLGFGPDELTGQCFLELNHPDDREQSGLGLAELKSGGAGRFERDTRLLHKDGSEVWVHVTGAGVISPDAELQFLVFAVEDLTGRRETEAQLRQAQKMEAVGQLTGGVAHDFNNLLTVVMSGIELALRNDNLSSQHRQVLESSLAAADRGAQLTNQLLSFSRRQSLNPEKTDFQSMLEDMQQLLDRLLGETISVWLDVDSDPGTGVVDRTQLQSALLNLSLNARDAMPKGGRLRLSARQVDLGAAEARSLDIQPGLYVEIAVEDEGLGMSEQNLERAVEPFFSTKEPGRGTGLGLSMVYGFATQSGGALLLSSVEGQGTEAAILLPVASEVVVSTDTGSGNVVPVPSASEKARWVLLVEDEPGVRTAVSGMLSELGYQVLEADDADRAFELLESDTEIDLLMTDVVLPGDQNGFELGLAARRIRPGLPVLYTSGYPKPIVGDAGEILADASILKKPYRRGTLATALSNAFNSATDTG